MYIAAFIYKPGETDEEFRRLSAAIDGAAAASPGFLGAGVMALAGRQAGQRQLLLAGPGSPTGLRHRPEAPGREAPVPQMV
ncbi:hypothetical protein ACU4GD_06115 [Cupriavidus basilensis]